MQHCIVKSTIPDDKEKITCINIGSKRTHRKGVLGHFLLLKHRHWLTQHKHRMWSIVAFMVHAGNRHNGKAKPCCMAVSVQNIEKNTLYVQISYSCTPKSLQIFCYREREYIWLTVFYNSCLNAKLIEATTVQFFLLHFSSLFISNINLFISQYKQYRLFMIALNLKLFEEDINWSLIRANSKSKI